MAITTEGGVLTAGPPMDPRRAARAIALVLTASFVINADVAIVAVAGPAIDQTLHTSVGDIELAAAAYQIAYAAALITGGRLGDIHGRRRIFILAFAGFAVASALCGLAGSIGQLIAFRILQGAFGGLLAPQVLATIQIALPEAKRVRAYAAQGVVMALATIVGPALAGLLISVNVFGLSWRPVFLINLPIGIVAVILAGRLIPAARSENAKNLDIPASFLIFVTVGLVMTALSVGQLYNWPLWCWLCLAVSPPLAWLFLWSQRSQERRGRSPLLPMDLWRDKAFRIGLLLYFSLFSGVGTFYVFYFFTLQIGYGISTWWAALSAVSTGIGAVPTAFASVRLSRRWGARRTVVLGAVISGAGFATMLLPVAVVHSGALAAWAIPSQFAGGMGMGLLLAPLLSMVLTGIRSSEAGAAAGLLTTAQMIGRALGVGITGLLFVIPLPHRLGDATIGDFSAGMSYALLCTPAAVALFLLIITRLPGPAAPSETESAHA